MKDLTLKARSSAELARVLGVECTHSDLVTIDDAALASLAAHIGKREDFANYTRSRWDDAKFWNVESPIEERSQYFTVGNSINFRFWTMAPGGIIEPARGWRGEENFTGSMYLWRSLRLCLDQRKYPILDATFLASLTEGEFDGIFVDDRGVNPLSIAKEDRIANLRDLGTKLRSQWRGQFYNVVAASERSLATFAKLSARFRAFDDPVLKLTMVNAILHSGSSIATFDSDPLPGIDYHLLKQLLRQGVIRVQSEFATKIERRQLITSAESFELRRQALCVFIKLSELTGISGEVLDNKYWWNRSKCKDRDPVCLRPETAHECPFYGPCERRIELSFPVEETRYY